MEKELYKSLIEREKRKKAVKDKINCNGSKIPYLDKLRVTPSNEAIKYNS